MATPSNDASIEDVTEDLQLHQVILQSLDEQRPGASEEREEIMDTIRDLEMRLAQLRGNPSPHPSQNNHRPSSSYLETPDPYPRMHPAQLDGGGFDVSPFGESPPLRWDHSSGTTPPSLPPLPGTARSPGSFPIRKRRHATASSSDDMQPPPKRVLGDELPRPSSPAASTQDSEQFDDGADDLRRLLGLDNEDTMMAFQDEQRKAEQWLKERKDQERRDEEYARMLHDGLSEQPRPASARSFASTNYSGSSLPFPEAPMGREPIFGDENSPFPRYNQPPSAATSHPHDILSRPPYGKNNILPDPRQGLPFFRQQASQPSSEFFKGDSDDSDIQEITPKDFRPSGRGPSYPPHAYSYNSPGRHSRNMQEPPRILPWGKSSQPSNSVYSPYGAAPGSSDAPGMGSVYGPSVLQNTMARLNAGRHLLQQAGRSVWGGLPGALPSQNDPYSFGGRSDPISQTMSEAFRNGPLGSYSSMDYIKYVPRFSRLFIPRNLLTNGVYLVTSTILVVIRSKSTKRSRTYLRTLDPTKRSPKKTAKEPQRLSKSHCWNIRS